MWDKEREQEDKKEQEEEWRLMRETKEKLESVEREISQLHH